MISFQARRLVDGGTKRSSEWEWMSKGRRMVFLEEDRAAHVAMAASQARARGRDRPPLVTDADVDLVPFRRDRVERRDLVGWFLEEAEQAVLILDERR